MNGTLRVLLTGSRGQVGAALAASAPDSVDLRVVPRTVVDIADASQVKACVAAFRPQIIVNAAAYTAVDKAETERDAAMRTNGIGPANLADAARTCSARLIHISTDFVFDGRSSLPYRPSDPPDPLSAYGASKLAGERAVLDLMPDSAVVVRTAWVYAAGGRNFLHTMLRLMKEHGVVNVVSDQVGTPTSAVTLANVLWRFAQLPAAAGVFHWTDAGVASWYDFAVAIAEEAVACGMLSANVEVNPIVSAAYPTPAKRPAYSVLDTRTTTQITGVRPEHWRIPLRRTIRELAGA